MSIYKTKNEPCGVCGDSHRPCWCEVISKADLRKLVEKWRNESTGSIYKVQTGYCADELEELLRGGIR